MRIGNVISCDISYLLRVTGYVFWMHSKLIKVDCYQFRLGEFDLIELGTCNKYESSIL